MEENFRAGNFCEIILKSSREKLIHSRDGSSWQRSSYEKFTSRNHNLLRHECHTHTTRSGANEQQRKVFTFRKNIRIVLHISMQTL